jgi:hypothetical protein
VADKEYKGPERRKGGETRRVGVKSKSYLGDTVTETSYYDRRMDDQLAGRPRTQAMGNDVLQGRLEEGTRYGIVETNTHVVRPERRMHGAGRRKGDFARALTTGESVIFQLGKGAWANAGKLAKKIISKKLKLGP